ncbi:type IV pilus biogenesis/stability protein PilW [Candidatus Parabeggiatoa sp. HSG14]|uniref:type IV pilus biogenesis/stability protein PilW n=1 Tax=Candidatus Parabeggiatoa sp. HSG14 TaxID=3055593 RepID=UPI0025A7317A|nr:type IV pilus biogenesis/stability protein PilW [Thiotrichales bacterium HSG14]
MIQNGLHRLFVLLLLLTTILNACASFKPCPEGDKKKADNNMQLGVEYLRRGRNDIALDKLKKALNQCANHAEAHHAIAVLYERLGEDDKAKPHYQKALTFNTQNSDVHNNYGQFLCKQKQWEEADKHFLEALKNPTYGTPEIPYTNAGLCALHNNNFAKAETYLRKALQKNSQFPRALYQMAQLNYEQKNYKQARYYLQRYTEIANHTPKTLWLGIRIERIFHNQDTEASYALFLRRNFPDSEETQLLNQSETP